VRPAPPELAAPCASLGELEAFLGGLPDQAYAQAVPALGASIGDHTRHLLEHYLILRRSAPEGRVHFEARDRDPRLSADRAAAMETLGQVRAWLEAGCGGLSLDLAVAAHTSTDGRLEACVTCQSTLRRELIYAFLHDVHHQALIAVAGRLLGLDVPPQLGKAPATRVHAALNKVSA
jgi:uncharacterized damage-inducible protein DinB